MTTKLGDPAIGVYFSVTIDSRDLGTFTSCDGLGIEVDVEKREEGGENSYVHELPGRMRYSHVKLSRAFDDSSKDLARWFQQAVRAAKRSTAAITVYTPSGTPLVQWSLRDVVPVRWTGPSFSSDGPKAATESIELAHHGFM